MGIFDWLFGKGTNKEIERKERMKKTFGKYREEINQKKKKEDEEKAKKEAFLILMQGKPINEPVSKYGPFVMNESHEIESVIAKYRITEFGGWPWPKAEMTHGSEPIRFATYPDQSTIYAEK